MEDEPPAELVGAAVTFFPDLSLSRKSEAESSAPLGTSRSNPMIAPLARSEFDFEHDDDNNDHGKERAWLIVPFTRTSYFNIVTSVRANVNI